MAMQRRCTIAVVLSRPPVPQRWFAAERRAAIREQPASPATRGTSFISAALTRTTGGGGVQDESKVSPRHSGWHRGQAFRLGVHLGARFGPTGSANVATADPRT